MKTAYVVTLYNGYNYGSVLQCLALQYVIKHNNVIPYVLDLEYTGTRWQIRRIVNNLLFYASFVKYPERKRVFQGIVENSRCACKDLSNITKEKIDRFVRERINIRRCRYEKLKKITYDNDCVACISGSDQVWGTSVKFLNSLYYLTFAPYNKRYSYAASFGSTVVPKWFRKKINRYLSAYRYISVREESGIKILRGLGIDYGEIMPDPTLLLTADEWVAIEKKPDLDTDDFEFAYFLNKPSFIAYNHIETIRNEISSKTKCFSPFNRADDVERGIEEISLSPEEFVWMIHHCKRMYTDSFHGVVFSILFHKDFYVYQRGYVGVPDQSSRIINILSIMNLEDQFIKNSSTINSPDFTCADNVILNERIKGHSCIRKILGVE